MQYNEPTIPAHPGDTVNFQYVENYDPKKYYKNVSGGLTRLPTDEELKIEAAYESMNN